jgi:hypothetical protein
MAQAYYTCVGACQVRFAQPYALISGCEVNWPTASAGTGSRARPIPMSNTSRSCTNRGCIVRAGCADASSWPRVRVRRIRQPGSDARVRRARPRTGRCDLVRLGRCRTVSPRSAKSRCTRSGSRSGGKEIHVPPDVRRTHAATSQQPRREPSARARQDPPRARTRDRRRAARPLGTA